MRPFKHMAFSATVLAGLFLAGSASAQWSTSGNSVGATDFLGSTNAGDIIIKTNNTERARITSGGNVGVGTSTPGRALEIFAASATSQFRLGENATDAWDFWGGQEFHITEVGSGKDWLYFSPTLSVFTLGPGSELYADLGGGTSRFGIGVTNPSSRLMVNGDVIPTADATYDLGTSTRRWDTIFAINGPINTSDARQKENIRDIGYGIDALMALRPVSFNWLGETGNKKTLGLIAQELRNVLPEVVKGGENDELYGVYYSDIIPVVVRAMQDQQREITARAETNRTLRERIEQRAERIRRLEHALANLNLKSGPATSPASSSQHTDEGR